MSFPWSEASSKASFHFYESCDGHMQDLVGIFSRRCQKTLFSVRASASLFPNKMYSHVQAISSPSDFGMSISLASSSHLHMRGLRWLGGSRGWATNGLPPSWQQQAWQSVANFDVYLRCSGCLVKHKSQIDKAPLRVCYAIFVFVHPGISFHSSVLSQLDSYHLPHQSIPQCKSPSLQIRAIAVNEKAAIASQMH